MNFAVILFSKRGVCFWNLCFCESSLEASDPCCIGYLLFYPPDVHSAFSFFLPCSVLRRPRSVDSLGELPYFLVSCWELQMESPGRIWEEGRRGRLGHFIPLAPSLRDHWTGWPFDQRSQLSGRWSSPYVSFFPSSHNCSPSWPLPATEENSCVGTNIRALL